MHGHTHTHTPIYLASFVLWYDRCQITAVTLHCVVEDVHSAFPFYLPSCHAS